MIGSEIDDAYIKAVKNNVLHPEIIEAMSDKINIVYTPLNGAGNVPVRRVLTELGFKNVHVVKEQEMPDGDFPTIGYPNPEDPHAFELALKLAEEVGADIVMATDPDSDRLGVYCKDEKNGGYISFNGNMSGMLIAEYIFKERQKLGTLPANGALVSTIVTTNMAGAVADYYGADNIETLTGFKYIGEQIKLFEETGRYEYVFGLEESYGCLVGTHARDKDAVAAVTALAEIAAYCKYHGRTLWDEMLSVYQKFGWYREDLKTLTMKGMEGAAEIDALMERLRNDPPAELGGLKVLRIRDYKKDLIKDLVTGETYPTGLRKSNVLYFELEKDSWCCARPSGTEPKIKFYMGTKEDSMEESDTALKHITDSIMELAGGR